MRTEVRNETPVLPAVTARTPDPAPPRGATVRVCGGTARPCPLWAPPAGPLPWDGRAVSGAVARSPAARTRRVPAPPHAVRPGRGALSCPANPGEAATSHVVTQVLDTRGRRPRRGRDPGPLSWPGSGVSHGSWRQQNNTWGPRGPRARRPESAEASGPGEIPRPRGVGGGAAGGQGAALQGASVPQARSRVTFPAPRAGGAVLVGRLNAGRLNAGGSKARVRPDRYPGGGPCGWEGGAQRRVRTGSPGPPPAVFARSAHSPRRVLLSVCALNESLSQI